MARILVIRFSAIGDVAMTIPVISSFAKNYPEHELIVLSSKRMASMFENLAPNISFLGVDFHENYRHFYGVIKLFKSLFAYKIDYVADLHGVLRAKFLRLLFWLSGCKIAYIHKGRFVKYKLTRRWGEKKLHLLKTTTSRYVDVFNRLGFSFPLTFDGIRFSSEEWKAIAPKVLLSENKNIGIAPFAKHKGKIYPLYLQEKVIETLSKRNDIKIFLFGQGNYEEHILNLWEQTYPNVVSMAQKFDLHNELVLMSHLDLMLSMDSANMHLASLVNTPVLSIWGATHPYCGFLGWKQTDDHTIQSELSCRPCSVYGQRKCYRKDYACMESILPEEVTDKILHVLFHQPLTYKKTKTKQPIKQRKYKIKYDPSVSPFTEKFIKEVPSIFSSEGLLIHNLRNTLKIFQIGENYFVVKKYKKPFFFNRLIYGFWRKSKASRAYEYSLKLLSKNIRTPKPVAFLESKKYGLFSDSFFINELSGCHFLYNHVALSPEKFKNRDLILKALGNFTAQMHENGFLHLDYSGGNLLFEESENDVLIDVIDLNRMVFGIVHMKKGCKSFERLLGTEEMITKIVEEYAAKRNFPKEKCVRLALNYRKKHMKKNESKYLSAIQKESYFSHFTGGEIG